MGTISTIIFIIGLLRLILKPTMSFIRKYAKDTPWQWDDKLVAICEEYKIIGILFYILDWFTSIKLVSPKTK